MLLKDTKKWKTSYVFWRKLENAKKKGNYNSSMDGTIDHEYDGQNLASTQPKRRAVVAVPNNQLATRQPRPTCTIKLLHWHSRRP
jgi:hypothetical protein